MTGPAPSPLARHILSLADTKRLLGIRYSDWILGSPSIETGIAASSMAQDEWGHARLLYSMLKRLGFDPFEVEHTRPAERYYSAPPLDDPFADWADFVAATVVVDGALSVAQRLAARQVIGLYGGGAFIKGGDAGIALMLGGAGFLNTAHAAVHLHPQRGQDAAVFGAPAFGARGR